MARIQVSGKKTVPGPSQVGGRAVGGPNFHYSLKGPSVMAHGYARSKVNFQAGKPANRKLITLKRKSSGGLNLNPFDKNNSISRAGQSVARNIPAGAGNRFMGNMGRIPGNIGNMIRGSNPIDKLYEVIGNRLKGL